MDAQCFMTPAPADATPAAPERLNRRQQAKAATRQQVMDAAKNLFDTVGYRGSQGPDRTVRLPLAGSSGRGRVAG